MATLTRSTSRTTPAYRDYVNFLEGYKGGRKDDHGDGSDSGVSGRHFSSSNSSISNSSSSINSDDFSKTSCVSFKSYLDSSKGKKFNPVKPNLDPKIGQDTPDFSTAVSSKSPEVVKPNEEKPTKRNEIFIEIQPTISVSEVSKMFENKNNRKSPPKSNKINSKINIFEKQISVENKPKIAEKPLLRNRSPPPKIEIEIKNVMPPPVVIQFAQENNSQLSKITVNQNVPPPPPPPPMDTPPCHKSEEQNKSASPPVATPLKIEMTHQSIENKGVPPPPPLPPMTTTPKVSPPSYAPPKLMNTPPKMQATLIKGPQVKSSVSSRGGVSLNEIDRNDPMVKKLVYGTLRGLYGAYHDKANDMMATLPKNMVKKNNGVQDIIEKIASNGDLEKLNGRVNPKLDQE